MLHLIQKLYRRFSLKELRKGLGITASAFIAQKSTVQYPEVGRAKPPRAKNMLALRRYPNGEERCIACKLCEAVCPALAITIESEPREDGSRRTTRFDIDAFKCIHCGLCEEACPVDSIVTTDQEHYVFEKRGDNIMSKEELLALGDYYEADIAKNREVDHAES